MNRKVVQTFDASGDESQKSQEIAGAGTAWPHATNEKWKKYHKIFCVFAIVFGGWHVLVFRTFLSSYTARN